MSTFPYTAHDIERIMEGYVDRRPNRAIVRGPDSRRRGSPSLAVHIDSTVPGGFWVASFAGDDPVLCKDHVRASLYLGSWNPSKREEAPRPMPAPRPIRDEGDDRVRVERA